MLPGRWSQENRAVLEELLACEVKAARIAVFDWDNTCIRGDIADATFHQLCRDLAFRFDAPGFWDWFGEAGLDTRAFAAYQRYCAGPTPEHRARLRLALEQTRAALQMGEDDTAALGWDSGAFVGWTPGQARAYTQAVIKQELAHPLEAETIGAAEGEPLRFPRGLREQPEMRGLVRALHRAGWQVWVLSGSPQWEVEPFAARFGIPRQRVLGMRRELVGGRITAAAAPPISYGDGKLDAYARFISREAPPLLVAGDSLGDWKILESSADVRLLIEPLETRLREFALWRRQEGEHWLIQKLD